MEQPYMLECVINDAAVRTQANPNMALLDFLRRQEHLTGTKEGCREGDCGACTVLLGELRGDRVVYRTVNSCLLPLGDVHGRHVVTIEGINQPSELNPVQQALLDEGGTQCGFCTPGFVISLTSCCIDATEAAQPGKHNGHRREAAFEERAADTVDGNICRCTGHTPIKKAIRRIASSVGGSPDASGAPLAQLVERKILPEYFLTITRRLSEIAPRPAAGSQAVEDGAVIVAGGTDLYVQRAFTMHAERTARIALSSPAETITETDDRLIVPGAATVDDVRTSPVIAAHFPEMERQLLLFGSAPIRHRATIAGNLANASPIGDMTCILMALDAEVVLEEGGKQRIVPLKKFYKGYKQLDKTSSEFIRSIRIPKPNGRTLSYEKVSRRQYLDIASVNSAMSFELQGDRIENAVISAGGVAPTMLQLPRTAAALSGKPMNADVLRAALGEVPGEISPISDARGSAAYKRLLLRQLIAAHVMKYFPDAVRKEAFV